MVKAGSTRNCKSKHPYTQLTGH